MIGRKYDLISGKLLNLSLREDSTINLSQTLKYLPLMGRSHRLDQVRNFTMVPKNRFGSIEELYNSTKFVQCDMTV